MDFIRRSVLQGETTHHCAHKYNAQKRKENLFATTQTEANTTTAAAQEGEDGTLGRYPQRGDDVPQPQPGVRSDLRALVSAFLGRNAAHLSTNDLARGDSPAARRLLACTQLPCTELYRGLDPAGEAFRRPETSLAGT